MTELIMASIPSYEKPGAQCLNPRNISVGRVAGGMAARTAAAIGSRFVEVHGATLRETIAVTAPNLWAQTTAMFAGFTEIRTNSGLDEGEDLDPDFDFPVVSVTDVRIPLALRLRAMKFRDRIAAEVGSETERRKIYFAHCLFVAALTADTMDTTVSPEEVPVPGSLTVVSI